MKEGRRTMKTSYRLQRVAGMLGVAAIAFGLLGLVANGGDAWAKRAKSAKDANAVADDSGGDGNAGK